MTANLLYVLGTLAGWIGWGMVIRTVVLAVRFFGGERDRMPAILTSAVLAAVGIGVSMQTPFSGPAAAYRLPLVWFVLPFPGWLAVTALALGVTRALQALLAVSAEERRARLGALGVWAVVLVLATAWYFRDPTSTIQVLRGSIPFTASMLAISVLALVAAAAAMTMAARHTASRQVSKTIVTQAALIAGSVVFGIPFVFLLITSFKEDRDMSSPNGIVWTPKVSLTQPYMDPKEPLYTAPYEGQTVQATLSEMAPDGTATMEVFKPISIRGITFTARREDLKEIPKDAPVVTAKVGDVTGQGIVIEELNSGERRIQFQSPDALKGKVMDFAPTLVEPVREYGLKVSNYPDALGYLPPETHNGLVYLKNTLILVVLSVVGTILSCSIVAYAFSRMQFPGRDMWFTVLLATMMLPGAVTLLPQFLIFRTFGWIDTLFPLWVPAFFASAFNVFLLRQFFRGIPMELEDAGKIDGCSYLRSFWSIMLPQIKPALAVIFIWTFMGAWNNFMGPLIYVNSPENMPLSYALQLFQGDRSGEPGLLMAFATMTMLPVLVLFFFMQRYFIEGVTLSGFGGR